MTIPSISVNTVFYSATVRDDLPVVLLKAVFTLRTILSYPLPHLAVLSIIYIQLILWEANNSCTSGWVIMGQRFFILNSACLKVLELSEYTTDDNPRRAINLWNHSKKVCVEKLSASFRGTFLVSAQMISKMNCLLPLSFTNNGHAKSHPLTPNGFACSTRSGSNGATVWSPWVDEKRFQIMQFLSRPFMICLSALSS